MAWWGIALAQGPNYNDSFMSPNRSAAAWAAIDRATAELDDETGRARLRRGPCDTRYAAEAPEDRSGSTPPTWPPWARSTTVPR